MGTVINFPNTTRPHREENSKSKSLDEVDNSEFVKAMQKNGWGYSSEFVPKPSATGKPENAPVMKFEKEFMNNDVMVKLTVPYYNGDFRMSFYTTITAVASAFAPDLLNCQIWPHIVDQCFNKNIKPIEFKGDTVNHLSSALTVKVKENNHLVMEHSLADKDFSKQLDSMRPGVEFDFRIMFENLFSVFSYLDVLGTGELRGIFKNKNNEHYMAIFNTDNASYICRNYENFIEGDLPDCRKQYHNEREAREEMYKFHQEFYELPAEWKDDITPKLVNFQEQVKAEPMEQLSFDLDIKKDDNDPR